jgi:hypothetical protein
MTALLLQVKNDNTYGHTIHQHIFAEMDPFEVGLFDKGARPLPVIRVVFALASENSSVRFSTPRQFGDSGQYFLRSSGASGFLENFTSTTSSVQDCLPKHLVHWGLLTSPETS